ncbi:CDP-glycerol glycerophosphotransferase family protein [Streptomyces sp. NPDC047130]|uniref:bifunctional glycosyltransferase/CDP-glycerol:glycerophosphate glycerophosphotransferase n=1 Tax=Streptomyces sp. NPDC047130 TaxID=3155261 RepID=UPI0033D7B2B3
MPRFSVVIPTHGTAHRLADALDSVVGRPCGTPYGDGNDDGDGDVEVEVVCVLDGRDAPAADVLAGRPGDPRIRTVVSPPSAGLGAARNAGLAAARGDYVLFLDGDDTLAPGARAAVAGRLAATGDPDVLVLGHRRVPWWPPAQPPAPRRAQPSAPGPRQPEEAAPDWPFRPSEAPRLTGVRLPAWSAAYRRAFLLERRLAFAEGWYTDLSWTPAAILAADRVAVLRRTVVEHRVRRQGSRLNEPGPHHLDLLDRAEDLLHRTAPLPAARREAVFTDVFALVLRTAADPRRLPAADRRAFFRGAADLYRRYRPAGYRPPGGSLGAQHRLLARGAHPAFRLLRAVHRGAGRLGAAAATPPRPLRGLRTRLYYRRALRRPLDPHLVVYCAYWGRGYACNPAAIHARARELAPHLRGVFLVEPEAVPTLPPGVEHAVIGTRKYWDLLARATYLVSNANLPDAVVKRPGTVHLQTQHGTPLKRMGLDQAAHPVVAAATGSFARLLARVSRWDHNLSSNPHSTETWERVFPGGHRTLEYGYPRNDVHLTATARDVARIRRELGVPEGATAVLFAPTHRDHAEGFDPAGVDPVRLAEAAGEDAVVLLRAHYFHDRAGRERAAASPRVIDVTSHRSAEEVCLAADVLVTDYSSIMFDYANLDRPMVIHAADWEVYRATRGVTFDLLAEPPGPVSRTPEELYRLLAEGVHATPEQARRRAAFRERFCPWDDGRAAERVVRHVLLGETPASLPPVVPLAARTPAPSAAPPRAPVAPPPSAPAPVAGAGPGGERLPHPAAGDGLALGGAARTGGAAPARTGGAPAAPTGGTPPARTGAPPARAGAVTEPDRPPRS